VALVAPTIAFLLAAAAWGASYAVLRFRCTQAAGLAAAAAARGAPDAAVRAIAAADAPAGAGVAVAQFGPVVTVAVRLAESPGPGLLALLPAIEVSVTERSYR
jgi:hypothetical protein